MKRTNRAAVAALRSSPLILNEETAVQALIDAGIIEADVLTEPERYAQMAREWIGEINEEMKIQTKAEAVYNYASGWSTDSWAHVTGENFGNDTFKARNAFLATVLLGKEAGLL